MIVRKFAGADSALVISDEWSSDRGDRLRRFDCNFICLMEKWVQIFKCKISHSSTKSLVPTLHKFTIQNFDLFFPFLEKTLCTYWLVNIWRGWKNIVPPETRIAFCRLFIVPVKTVCYEYKVLGELPGCFLYCTLGCLRPYVSTTSFRLRNKVECQCNNETNIAPC